MEKLLFIKVKRRYVSVNIATIIYAEVNNAYISIVTDKKTYVTLAALTDLETYLPKNKFCKVHRAYIVALDRVTGFDSGNVYLKDKAIPISYNCRDVFIASVNILTRKIPTKSEKRNTIRKIQQRMLDKSFLNGT